MNDDIKKKLLLMLQGQRFENKENLSKETLESYGFLWFEIENSWIKVFR